MVSDVPAAAPRINVEASIRDLRHELRLMLGSLDTLTARLERMDRELEILEGARSVRACKPSGPERFRVAYNLEILPCADGSGSIQVAIDGGRRFYLGPRLAEVFQFIASGEKDPAGADPLVGWRSKEEIIRFLQGPTDKQFRADYVIGMVFLLRQALCKAGYDRRLIQSNKLKGYRFAFKRGARGLLPPSPPEW